VKSFPLYAHGTYRSTFRTGTTTQNDQCEHGCESLLVFIGNLYTNGVIYGRYSLQCYLHSQQQTELRAIIHRDANAWRTTTVGKWMVKGCDKQDRHVPFNFHDKHWCPGYEGTAQGLGSNEVRSHCCSGVDGDLCSHLWTVARAWLPTLANLTRLEPHSP